MLDAESQMSKSCHRSCLFVPSVFHAHLGGRSQQTQKHFHEEQTVGHQIESRKCSCVHAWEVVLKTETWPKRSKVQQTVPLGRIPRNHHVQCLPGLRSPRKRSPTQATQTPDMWHGILVGSE